MPELTISVDQPLNYVYSPGGVVSGKVIFTPNFNARLRSLQVSLRGECFTSSVGPNTKISNVVPLVDITSHLLQAAYTLASETYEALFQFEFPSRTTAEHVAGPPSLLPLFNQRAQLLPNSFVLSTRNTIQCVRYFIHVELQGRRPAVTEETVLFRQLALNVNANTTLLRHVTHELGMTDYIQRPRQASHGDRPDELRRPNEASLSLHALPLKTAHQRAWWERFKYAKSSGCVRSLDWCMKPWKKPRITFMPSIYIPRDVSVGQQIPLLLAIDSSQDPRWQKDEFPLRLTGFSVAVTAHTRTIIYHRPSAHKLGRCMELSYLVIEAKDLRAPIDVNGKAVPLIANFKILPGVIPSFQTYSINRGYTVDIYLHFRYDGGNLDWGASMSLEITSDDTSQPAQGQHLDLLLRANPHHSPECCWTSNVEVGAADSTARTNGCPRDVDDAVVSHPSTREKAHGRLPRSSYACASAILSPELDRFRNVRRSAGTEVKYGIYGQPNRRYLMEMEPLVQPLYAFGAV